ncbi:MAG TPA: DoxX family protein [Candidatus Eisenbacteria bacterium]|nr:DoxX family protein [Candidatus Eisenbacteria bacterium]
MTNGSDRLTSISLLLLRVGAGGLLLYGHGIAKLLGYAERAPGFADPIGLGPELGFALVVFAEVLCAALVALGFLTRLATVPILGFMLVAALIHHAADPWPKRELPLLFFTAFLPILLMGAGRYSVDGWFRSRKERSATRTAPAGAP